MKNKNNKTIIIVVSILCGLVALAAITFGIVYGVRSHKEKVLYDDLKSRITQEWDKTKKNEQPEFLNIIDSRASFTFLSYEKIEEGYYTVKVQATSPDISSAMIDFQEEIKGTIVPQEEMFKRFEEIASNAELKTTEQSIDVIFDDENNCYVEFPQDFADAMLGYFYNDTMAVVDKILTGGTEE